MKFWIRKGTAVLALLSLMASWPSPTLAIDAENPDEMVDRMNFRAMELITVLAMLEELTGRSIIRPTQLPNPEIYFDSHEPMTKQNAVRAIESLLSINGIGVAPMGEDFLVVVPVGTIKTEAPELVVDSLAERAPSGQVVSKLFRLEYLDSQSFQTQIQPFLSPQFGSIIPFQNSNAVIVTDTVRNLQRLEYVVSEVDKPSRLNIDTRFYTLQYAQASEVAQQIQTLIENARSRFGEEGDGSRNRPGRRTDRRTAAEPEEAPPLPAGVAGESIPEQILFGSNTAISSDDRTNQIIIMAEPANFTFFDNIIAKLDIKADPTTRIEVITLKHADAVEVQSLLSQFVSGETSREASDRSQANARDRAGRLANRSDRFSQRQQTTTTTTANQMQDRVNQVVNGALEERDSQFSSFMTIIADERSNSLMVSGTRSDLELIREVIDRIDVLLAQVQIEVIIVDVTLTNNVARGSEVISAIYDDVSKEYDLRAANLFGLNLSGTTFTVEDGNVANLLVEAVFERARSDSNINVLSVPTIVTTHNKEAVFSAGQEQPIVTSTQSLVTGGVSDSSFRSNVEFAEILVSLKVKPLIGPNDIIQMEIEQTIDEVAGSVVINGNQTPIIATRAANSFVSVKNNELVILGGLQRESANRNVDRPAILGEIPLLGRLFSRRSKDSSKTELMVFIRPTVMRTTEEVNAVSRDKVGKIQTGESVEHYVETNEISLRAKKREDEDARLEPSDSKSAIRNRIQGGND